MDTIKVVINNKFGGFSLSEEGVKLYYKKKGRKVYTNDYRHYKEYADAPWETSGDIRGTLEWRQKHLLTNSKIERTDPDLISTVETLGKKSWGIAASLKVVNVPSDCTWEISCFDGYETIECIHQS